MARTEISVEADWAGQPWSAADRENWTSVGSNRDNVSVGGSSTPTAKPEAESESIQVESANESTSTQEDSEADTAVQEANTNTIQPSEAEEVQAVTPADYSWITDVSDEEEKNIEDFQLGQAVDKTGLPEDFGFTQEQMDESNNSISLNESWEKAQEYADEFRSPVSKLADNFIGNMKDKQLYNFLNKNGTNVSLTEASEIQTAVRGLDGKLSLEGALKYDDYSQLKKDAELASGNVASAGMRIFEKTGELVNDAATERVAAAIVAIENNDNELAEKLLSSKDISLGDDFKSFLSNPANKLLISTVITELAGLGITKAISKGTQAVMPKLVEKLTEAAMSDNKIAIAAEKILNNLAKNKEVRANLSNNKKWEAYLKSMNSTLDSSVEEIRLRQDLTRAINSANKTDDVLRFGDVRAISQAAEKGLISATDAAKAIAEINAGKSATVGTGIAAGTATEASARPTGYATPEGKSLDSKDIVEEYQKTPYEGDDAVTIQSREGEVTLPAKQAVIVAEAEGLSKSDGYTDEVKDLASETTLSETNRDSGQLGYDVETSRPTSTPAEIVTDDTELTSNEKAGLQQSIDILQALAGGRDLNNDGTITAKEQIQVYKDTVSSAISTFVEPIVDLGKEFIGTTIKIIDAITPGFIDDLGMLKYLSPKQYIQYEANKTGLAIYDTASNIANVIAHPVVAIKDAAGNVVEWTEKQYDKFKSSLASNVVNLLPNWSDTARTDATKSITASIIGLTEAAFVPALAVRAGANYISSTVREIAHLQGYDMTEDQVRALNLAACNLLGLVSMPVGTVIRDFGTVGAEGYARTRTETVLEFGASNPIIPISNGDTLDIDVKLPSKPGASSAETTYGTETGTVEDADAAYSGAVANAKNSNLATDYNYGMEQQMNEAVSDGKVKEYIISIYKNEPGFIKNAISKVLKSFKESV